jgi:soluble lytic murein transglycosylase-like protein
VPSTRLVGALSVIGLLAASTPASAELVFFTTGRSLSVRGHRTEGSSLILTLRDGAEVACEPAVIARIAPDEVPYPEPEPAPAETRAATPAVAEPRLGADMEAFLNRVAAQEGVDARLVRAVIEVESGYEPRARSPKGAMGLMQLMPETARQYAVADPYDPAANIEAGIKHLKSLLARFPPALALAAYNAGDAAVERFHGIPPYAETRNYVARILRILGRS